MKSKAATWSALAVLCLAFSTPSAEPPPTATEAFDLAFLKEKWRARIKQISDSGRLPIIDINSKFSSPRLDAGAMASRMDQAGIALIAFSPVTGNLRPPSDIFWPEDAAALYRTDPARYIPVTPVGGFPHWIQEPARFLHETFNHVDSDHYPLMGEFFFHHRLSEIQAERSQMYWLVDFPINGPLGQEIFAFSEKSGIPFLIHYEIEDAFLPQLEEMLRRYPKAKVVWCHFAQIKYSDRSTKYDPAYVRHLLNSYPNLHFDLAVAGPEATYLYSGEHPAKIWDARTGGLDPRWRKIIEEYPWRFHAALDLGTNRMDAFARKLRCQRRLLNELPAPIRSIVAYRSAWKLLFNEDF